MIRKVTFEDSDEGRRRFKFIWDGFRAGTMSQKPEARTPDVMRNEAEIRKLLKSVSTNGEARDIDARDLQAGGGSVSFEQPLIKLIIAYGWAVQWTPASLEDAIDALDFIDSCPEDN